MSIATILPTNSDCPNTEVKVPNSAHHPLTDRANAPGIPDYPVMPWLIIALSGDRLCKTEINAIGIASSRANSTRRSRSCAVKSLRDDRRQGDVKEVTS